MVVNGATIRFRTKCRIELVSQARFLFGKQIMAVDEAATSLRFLYYKMQTAYVGPLEDRADATRDIQRLLTELQRDSSPTTKATLFQIEKAFAAEDFYQALKVLRVLVQDENVAGRPVYSPP